MFLQIPQMSPPASDVSECVRKLHFQLLQIQGWLNLDWNVLYRWRVLAEGYINWMNSLHHMGEDVEQRILQQFPLSWSKYLRETNQTDFIPTLYQGALHA